MKTKITLLLLFLIMPFISYAGSLKGYVRDSETNEPLISASVTIKGTTIGTVTDLNGYYELPISGEGDYTFSASYIGYEDAEVTFSIGKNEELVHDFLLVASSYQMEEVVVTVQARGQINALNQQLNSEYISNVVSSERLQEVPDATIADALARVPGITVRSDNGEGNKIQIRGMEPRLNLVTVNGVRAPSADRNENSVGLAGISPFMIEEIEVQKSLTPDKDGDVVGGIVDLKLKDAEEGFHFNAVVQNNYNNLVGSLYNPRTTLQVSNRFLDNKLGVVLVGNYEDIDRSSERMSASGNVLTEQDPIMIETRGSSFWTSEFNRKRYGGSLFLDYRLPKGKIKASSFINGLDNDEFTRTYVWNFGSNINRNISSRETHTLSMVNSFQLEQKLFWNSTIEIGAAYTAATNNTDVAYGMNSKYRTPSTQSAEDLPEEIRRIRRSQETIYPYELLVEANFISDSSYFLQTLSSYDNVFKEDELTGFVNWKFPFHIGSNVSGTFKMGGKYRKKTREYDASDRGHGLTVGGQEQLRQYMLIANPDIDFGLGEFNDYVENNFATFHLLSDYDKWILNDQFRQRGFVERSIMEQIIYDLDEDHWSVVETGEHPRRNIADDYSGHEEVTAGYGMVDMNITKYVQLVGGVRIEDIKTNYKSYGVRESGVINFVLEEFDDSLSVRQSTFVLPMVNLNIQATDWLKIRLAYSQSIARPRYYSYMPRYRLDRLKFIDNIGNPELEPALSENIDAYVSVKTNNQKLGVAGVLTAGVFHKKIEGYEYVKDYVNVHDSVNSVHPYDVIASNRSVPISVPINNPEPAYSKGFEIDWQGAFIYLPSPLNGIVLNANYTLTETEQTQIIQRVKKTTPDPSKPWIIVSEVMDTSYQESMFSQPRHIINASLGYDLKGFSARLAYTRTSETFAGYFGTGRTYPENRRLSAMQQVWDLSITQVIPKVEGLQLFLNVSNITSTFNSKEFVNVSSGGDPYPLYEEYFGRIIILGLRYRL